MSFPLDFVGGTQVANHPVGFLATVAVLAVGLGAIGLATGLAMKYKIPS